MQVYEYVLRNKAWKDFQNYSIAQLDLELYLILVK